MPGGRYWITYSTYKKFEAAIYYTFTTVTIIVVYVHSLTLKVCTLFPKYYVAIQHRLDLLCLFSVIVYSILGENVIQLPVYSIYVTELPNWFYLLCH